jgi:sugar O-acyltransferase (sialic acid O-acetyltransferase NeuD family)
MADVVIFGAGMSAQVAHTFLKRDSDHRVVGFTVDAAYATSDRFERLPLVPWDRLETVFPPREVELFGPFGHHRLNEFRRDRYLEGKARGYRFASFIHPTCVVYASEMGDHCFMLPGTIIDPHVTIGNNVIIWGGSYIGHHCTIGDHCFISGRVGIGGASRLGERCFLGIMVGTLPGLTIGEGSFISAGSFVTKNIHPGSIIRRTDKVSISRVPAARIRDLL